MSLSYVTALDIQEMHHKTVYGIEYAPDGGAERKGILENVRNRLANLDTADAETRDALYRRLVQIGMTRLLRSEMWDARPRIIELLDGMLDEYDTPQHVRQEAKRLASQAKKEN